MKIIAQLFGVGAMASLFLIYQQKSRKKILLAKLSADAFWVIHYLCLGGIAGMIPNAVGIFREMIFLLRKEKKWANTVLIPIVFILINWLLGFRTFHTWYNLLPITASTFVTISLWIDNPKLTKLMTVPICAAFLVYDLFVGSYIGIVNESISIISIIIFFCKENKMNKQIFTDDIKTDKELIISKFALITNVARTITADVDSTAVEKGERFAKEITDSFLSDFEKVGDKMAHVSTFRVIDGIVYMTYYANTKEPSENPENQTARLVFAPIDDLDSKTFIDIQTTGDKVGDKTIDMVYDTILMQKDKNTIFIMWTARITEGNYYRFYCPFDVNKKKLGNIGVDKFYRLRLGRGWWEDEQPSEEIKAYVESQISNNKIDVVLSHTCPLKYEPKEMFLPMVDQSSVDQSTEIWLDSIEEKVDYRAWLCGHWHTDKRIDRIHFLYNGFESEENFHEKQ